MPPAAQDEFRVDLGIVSEAVQSGVTQSYTRKKDGHWGLWLDFCTKINIDPHMRGIVDPVPYLQVFSAR